MKNNQREILLRLIEMKNDGFIYENNPFYILIHSVLNTIEFENLLRIYLDNSFKELNPLIFSNLKKRIINESNIENIYDSLKELLECSNEYKALQRLRVTIELLLSNLPDNYKADYFSTFFYSKYLNDKKSALKYLKHSVYNVDSELLKLYLSTKNNSFLDPILKRRNRELLTNWFYELWNEDLYFKNKMKLVKCISPLEENIESFLERKDPEFHFEYNLSNGNIKVEKLLDKIKNSTDQKRHFYIWHASKLVKFEILEPFIKTYL